jgi:hypothetical protein
MEFIFLYKNYAKMFHFTVVVSLSMKQKNRKKHQQLDGTLAMIISEKDIRNIYHFAGIFSLFNFYNNLFFRKWHILNVNFKIRREKKIHLGAL